jgi:shikimate kinase
MVDVEMVGVVVAVPVLIPGRNIVLIGMMGAGKSTVGEILAERLERPFVDTDALVAREADMPIEEIFAQRGERAFRDLEAEVIRRVSALKGQVIAVGGGAVTSPANVTNLQSTGDLVHLDAQPETLAERVDETDPASRPLLADADDVADRLRELAHERAAAYARAAALVIDTTGKPPEEIAEVILDWAGRRHGLLAREERQR